MSTKGNVSINLGDCKEREIAYQISGNLEKVGENLEKVGENLEKWRNFLKLDKNSYQSINGEVNKIKRRFVLYGG
jgi:hypothetical protein